ncbi:MAG: cell division protein ZipA [Gammaproteobacteria bacterium]|jgi:cell division protein ZipA|nr:cell division protein ZipA [Gammaproteobacteria bacterium]
MDAATLRLILVVLGAVFLIGLFLWEKQRSASASGERARPAKRAKPTPRSSPSAERRRQEPNLGGLGDDGLDESAAPSAAAAQNAAADAEAAPSSTQTAAPPQGEPLLIQLYITSTGGAFSGDEILSAAERCKLRPGDMNIFHRTRGDAPDGEPLFSMANLVKPGTFPFDDMTEFASPGLAVFAQFEGEPSDLMVFDEMLDATRVMAELLGGDIRGPHREPLRDADAKALRAQVRALLHGSDEGAEAP